MSAYLTGTAPNQTLHRFSVPGVIDGIALQTFDGNGAGTRKDFVMLNGTRLRGAPADFESDETLSYTVNPDCTGALLVHIGNGKRTISTRLIVLDHGNQLFSVTAHSMSPLGRPPLTEPAALEVVIWPSRQAPFLSESTRNAVASDKAIRFGLCYGGKSRSTLPILNDRGSVRTRDVRRNDPG
jgi:hypothetical protein